MSEVDRNSFKQPEVRAKLYAMRQHTTRAERKEAAKLRLFEANYRKLQERQALKEARNLTPVNRPHDPFLDQLAAERAERFAELARPIRELTVFGK